MLLKSRQDAEEFVFWCVTLQCGVLPQGYRMLQDAAGGYCCIAVGVACTVPEEKIRKDSYNSMLGFNAYHYASPDWLERVNCDVREKTNESLVNRNDNLGQSHKEIGTLLLELYEDELNYWFSVSPGK